MSANIFILVISLGIISFISRRHHMLMSLMSLEYLAMGVFVFLGWFFANSPEDGVFMLYYLVFVACEGALGLGTMVSMVKSYGNDLLGTAMFTQC